MHPTYRQRISSLCEQTSKALADAKNETEIVAAQNAFNNGLNEIKAQAKQHPNGQPSRNTTKGEPVDENPIAAGTPAEPAKDEKQPVKPGG